MSRTSVVGVFVLLSAACAISSPRIPAEARARPEFGAADVVAIQVDGYDGALPARIHDKEVVRVSDVEDWVLARPGTSGLQLTLSFDSSDRARALTRFTWGTGQHWLEAMVGRGTRGWEITDPIGGGYTF